MDQIGRLNALQAASNTKGTSNVQKTENSTPIFATKAADDGGFYPGLSLNKGVPQYNGINSTLNFLDYLQNNDIL